MKTRVLPCDGDSIALAAELIRSGEVVAFPTETVYGLGADARNPQAVRKIFAAKNRPADNPLISHILGIEQLRELAEDVPDEAVALERAFWPGPLTMILRQRRGALPQVTTAGLSSFSARSPSHPAARELIRIAGCPIAAPSANASGRPSPTTSQHVLADMEGKIPLILDGGPCDVGLESTVVSLLEGGAVLLRPGGVTLEMLRHVLGEESVSVGRGVREEIGENEAALSPGMKHRHYAPRAPMAVVDDPARLALLYDEELARGGRPFVLSADAAHVRGREGVFLGERPEHAFFGALREADERGATLVLFAALAEEGVGYAVMNRALRASGFRRESS